MQYNDKVYGTVEISDPILLELMDSSAMTRLKTVLQHGISGLIGVTEKTTRFEHSVGTMLLVRRLGGSLEEQIAALLHDVSHTAFSHVIDYVFHGHEEQDFHDAKKESYIAASDIPAILASRNYDWRLFIDEELFPLLEQPAPALCADRIDYFVRDALGLGLAVEDEVNWALAHLQVIEERIVLNDLEAARWFGSTYMEADKSSWANFREVALYELTAVGIRRALEIDELVDDDFWAGDEELWDKLQASRDPFVMKNVGLVNARTEFVWDAEHPDFLVSTKIRTIDPDVIIDSNIQKLSAIDPEFRESRQAYLQSSQGVWPIRIVSK